jgi:hypothetical protein
MDPFFNISFEFEIQNRELVRLWQDKWRGYPLKDTLYKLYTFAYNTQLTIKEAKDISNWDDQLRQPLTQQVQQQKKVYYTSTITNKNHTR